MSTTILPILHFNDVYRVVPQKYKPGSSETIETSQFAWLVDSIRDQWPALEGTESSGPYISPPSQSDVAV